MPPHACTELTSFPRHGKDNPQTTHTRPDRQECDVSGGVFGTALC